MKSFSRLIAWAFFWLIAALVVFFIARPNLPDIVAIHWNGAGLADGSVSASWLLVTPLLAIAIGGLIGGGVSCPVGRELCCVGATQ